MLRRKKLGSIPNRTDWTRSPGRCGQASSSSSSSSVGSSLGRESHKGPVYIWVCSFAKFFLSFLLSSPLHRLPRPARADTRYPTSQNFTCVSCQTVSLRNRCMRHRHSHSGETKLPSSNTVDSIVDSWEYRRTRAGSRKRTKLLGFPRYTWGAFYFSLLEAILL